MTKPARMERSIIATSTRSYFEIRDLGADTRLGITVKSEDSDGIAISLEGCSTKTSADGYDDAPIYFEYVDGKPILRIWADINSEEPTHVIDLSGAHTSRRHKMFSGHLYYYDHSNTKRHVCAFEEEATAVEELEKKILEQSWDPRLEAGGFAPYFEYTTSGE